MTPLANGRIVFWQGGSLWVFDVPPPPPGAPRRTDFHAHHAIQITLALGGTYELQVADQRLNGPATVVAPDVRHAFEPVGRIALLFVEPESPAGRAIVGRLLQSQPFAAAPLPMVAGALAEIQTALTEASDDRLRAVAGDLVDALAGDMEASPADARVEASIAWAAANLDRRVSVAQVAQQVGLSVGRMSHLFVEHTGLPFRTYLLWLRIGKAVQRYAAGASLTDAAHEAGFADSAHLSRTFRRMFGVAAAELRLG